MTKLAATTLFALLTLASCGETAEPGAASTGSGGNGSGARAGAPAASGGQATANEAGKSAGGGTAGGGTAGGAGAPSKGGDSTSAGTANSGGGANSGGAAPGGSSAGDDGATSGGAAGASMAGAGGAATAGSSTGGSACRPELLLLLDRSASMQDPPDGATLSMSKWELVVAALDQALAATESAVGWGLKAFPEGEGLLCAMSVTSAVDVPLVASAQAMSAAIHATIPNANGTPTGDAVNAAATYLATRPSDRPRYLVLVTDGEPSCAGSVSSSEVGRSFAVESIAAAAQAGIHTFVVGVDTTKLSASTTLNSMAMAGLEPRAAENPLATQYYLSSNVAELTAALETISNVAACP